MFRQQIEISAWDCQHIQSDYIHHYSSLQPNSINLPNQNQYDKSNRSKVLKFQLNKGPKLSKTKFRTKPLYPPKLFHQKSVGQDSSKLVESRSMKHNQSSSIVTFTNPNRKCLEQSVIPLKSCECRIVNLYQKLSDKIYGDDRKQNIPKSLKQEKYKPVGKYLKPKISAKVKQEKILGQTLQECSKFIRKIPRLTNCQFQFLSQLPIGSSPQKQSQYLQCRRKQLAQYLQRKRSHHFPSKRRQNQGVLGMEQNSENRNRLLVRDVGKGGRCQRACSLQIKEYRSCGLGDGVYW